MPCKKSNCGCSSVTEPTISERLTAMGLTLPEVVPPLASYTPAVCFGHTVYTSGQLPVADGSFVAVGKVGVDVSTEQAYDCAKQCALNALAAAANLVGLDSIRDVIKVTGFVNSGLDYDQQATVLNGASDFFGELFGRAHARSAVGVACLPKNSPVEVEVIFSIK